ncbi:MAG: periplasmic protein TonB [Blastocatellia bacterium]|nr:periplasmic protein TonB [Blastocatellia bacterium]
MLMNEATVCPVCRQPIPPAQGSAAWPQPNQPSGPTWQQPAGQPSFGPPPLAGGTDRSLNVVWLVAIVAILLLMVGGIFGALVYFKSQRSTKTTRANDNYNRYSGVEPIPYTEPPPPPPAPPFNGNGGGGTRRAPISGGVLNGKAISLPKPVYPPVARAANASGAVIVQITIDETGKVISARAVSGHPLLQASAVQAAYQARFSPTQLSGQPVKVTGTLSYNFTLE